MQIKTHRGQAMSYLSVYMFRLSVLCTHRTDLNQIKGVGYDLQSLHFLFYPKIRLSSWVWILLLLSLQAHWLNPAFAFLFFAYQFLLFFQVCRQKRMMYTSRLCTSFFSGIGGGDLNNKYSRTQVRKCSGQIDFSQEFSLGSQLIVWDWQRYGQC